MYILGHISTKSLFIKNIFQIIDFKFKNQEHIIKISEKYRHNKFPCIIVDLGQFSRIFRRYGETFAGIVRAAKFCLVGGALFGARAFEKMLGEKVPGWIGLDFRRMNRRIIRIMRTMRMIKTKMKIRMR